MQNSIRSLNLPPPSLKYFHSFLNDQSRHSTVDQIQVIKSTRRPSLTHSLTHQSTSSLLESRFSSLSESSSISSEELKSRELLALSSLFGSLSGSSPLLM